MRTCLAALLFSALAFAAAPEPEATPCILESDAGCEVAVTFTSVKDEKGVYHNNFLLSVERPRGLRAWIEFDVYHQTRGKWMLVGSGTVPPGDPQKSDRLLLTVGRKQSSTLRVVVRIAGKGDVYPLETTVLSYRM